MKYFIPAVVCMFVLGCRPVVDQLSESSSTRVSGIQLVNEPKTVSGCSSPVVMIRSTQKEVLNSIGNACIINHGRGLYVLTAWHIISDGGVITLWDGPDKRIDVQLGSPKVLESADVAVIPILSSAGKLASFTLDTSALQTGEFCTVQGYTQAGQLAQRTGEITSVRLETTIQVERGLSGSPLVRGSSVIGVTTAVSASTNPTTGLVKNGGIHTATQNFIKLFN